MQTTASLVNFQMSIGQQNTAARHLTIRYYEPTYFCALAQNQTLWGKHNGILCQVICQQT